MQSKIQKLIDSNKIMVFSKTYCPYCVEAKNILTKLGAKPNVLELDLDSEGSKIQDELKKMFGQSTVPNVFIGGNHIGGCSDLKDKMKTGELLKLLQ